MARYIDAEALTDYMLDRYNELCEECGDYDHYTTGYGDAIDAIENAPTADVVPKSDDAGIMLTFDGATGYFPKAFLIEAVKAYQKQGKDEDRYIPLVDENLQRVFDSYKKHVVTELLSDLKKSIHNNAVYTSLGSVNYIPLKTFDAIIQQYVNKLKEGEDER